METLHLEDDKIQQETRSQINRVWEFQQHELQTQLDVMSLPGALRQLTVFHYELGFLEDDLSGVRYFPCADRNSPWHFLAQFNAPRATRVAVGRAGSCVLDTKDLRRQQRGLQYVYPVTLNGRFYNAMTNPFPFARCQTTIASTGHESQGWQEHDSEGQRGKVRRIVEDLFTLAQNLPGWIVAYNGPGAGATINHLHFHVFELLPGHGPFPIQIAAEQILSTSKATSRVRFGGDSRYPVTVFRFGGSQASAVEGTCSLIGRWNHLNPHAATVNLMAVTEDDQVCIYVIPRNRFFESSAGFAYRVGSMEIFGEFIYSKEGELQDLQQGRIDFRRLWNILKAVNPLTARSL